MNRRDAEELLPWFVAGTLDEEEARGVQAFIDSGEITKSELADLAEFSEAVAETGLDEPAYDPAILKRAMGQLDEVVQQQPEAPLIVTEPSSSSDPADEPGFFQRLLDTLQWSTTPPLARILVAGQFALLLGLVVVIGGQEQTDIDSGFETVAGSSQQRPADFTVSFAPGVTEADIRALLLANEATIVGGPSSLGIYQLATEAAADRDDLQQSLSGSPLVIFLQEMPQP